MEDNSEVNPIVVNGESYTATANNAVFFGNKEYVFDGEKWHEFGDITGLGDLASKNFASTVYTPSGTISAPEFLGDVVVSTGKFTPSGSISVNESNAGNYQPSGTVSAPAIQMQTAGDTTVVNSITEVGTLPNLELDVDESLGNLTITFTPGTLPTKGDNVTVKTTDAVYIATAPSFSGAKVQLDFSGNESNVSISGVASGTISAPTFTGQQSTIVVS
jgi:hypothetical protein